MSSNNRRLFEDVPVSDAAVSFLQATYPRKLFEPIQVNLEEPPFVTLTYAQSMDAKIAGAKGKQLILSGKESMELTHRMRELHDSILVGIGTMLNDDPQLNARIPSLLPVELQPTPIILDNQLRTPPDCKLMKNFRAGIGKRPVIVGNSSVAVDQASLDRGRILEEAGAKLVFAEVDDGAKYFNLKQLFAVPRIRKHFGRSLMIEGGSAVISSYLSDPQVDLVVTTVAPTIVGEGVDLIRRGTQVPELDHVRTQIFGKDVVFASKPVKKEQSRPN